MEENFGLELIIRCGFDAGEVGLEQFCDLLRPGYSFAKFLQLARCTRCM